MCMMLLVLNDDVFYVIFNYLTLRDLTALKVVNRRLRGMVDKYVSHKLESCWHGITPCRAISVSYLTSVLGQKWSFGAPLLDNIIQLGKSTFYDVGEVIHTHDDKYSQLVELQDGDEVLYEFGEPTCNIIHPYLSTGKYAHAYMYYLVDDDVVCRLFLFPKRGHGQPIVLFISYSLDGHHVEEYDVMEMLCHEILVNPLKAFMRK